MGQRKQLITLRDLGAKEWTDELIDFVLEEGWKRIDAYKPKENKRRITLECPFGHRRTVAWKDHLRGFGCAVCSNNATRSEEYVKSLLDPGWELIKFTNASTPCELRCPLGHIALIVYGNYIRGDRCGQCSKFRKKTIEEVDVFLASIEYTRTEPYKDTNTPCGIICNKGHKTKLTISRMMCNGTRCRKCYEEGNIGEGNPLWDHSKTPEEREKGRHLDSGKLNQFKKTVYERDGYKCRICNTPGNGINLNAHHIQGYDKHKDLRTDPDNGVCWCNKCHSVFHFYFGKGNNTREQYDIFLDLVSLGEFGELPFEFNDKELFKLKWKEKTTNHVTMLMIEMGINPYKRIWNGMPPLHNYNLPDDNSYFFPFTPSPLSTTISSISLN